MNSSSATAIAEAQRLFRSGRATDAEKLLRAVIAKDATAPRAFELLAYIRGNQNDLAGCEGFLAKAAALPNCSAEALFYLGRVQVPLGKPTEAAQSLLRALKLAGDFFEGLHELGVAYSASNQHEQALQAFRRAERLQARSPELQSNLGDTLAALRQFDAALTHYDRALSLEPRFAQAWANRGTVLAELGRGTQALESHDKALALDPQDANTWMNRAATLVLMKRYEDALASFDKVAQLAPGTDYLPGHRLHASMHVADWKDWSARVAALAADVDAGKKVATPFTLMGLPVSSQTLLTGTRTFMQDRHPAVAGAAPIATGERTLRKDRRLRVAYFSTDFRNHATSQLLARVLECHDHERFEWFGFSLWPHAADDMTQRVAAAFDHFQVVASQGDTAIAKLSRDAGIDIAVDLNGLTEGMRPGIFAHRAAPVQVNYLGYPGSMGVDYMDYLLADRTLVLPADYGYYAEKIVHLPGSYQPNDNAKPIAQNGATRGALGLPADGFVFACFNNTYKITPDVFDVWMRLLHVVPGSVLWLLAPGATAQRGIEAEAQSRGIDASRLVWAPRMPLAEHLARHAQADLFLDTFHYNAHTTASDALWAGLPLVTLAGATFPARVGASLLRAVGLPELVAEDAAGYEALALRLANTPSLLSDLRNRLATNRLTSPVFDSERFARRLEAAYDAMWARHESGLRPDHIHVAD